MLVPLVVIDAIPVALGVPVAALLGLCFGSFVTLASYRLPRGEPILMGRSRCPSCGAALGIRDLVPVLSWLMSRRRCRHCAAPVSPRYALIELFLGGVFVGLYLYLGATPALALLAALAVGLVTLAVTDLEAGIIPDKVLLVLAPLGMAYQYLTGDVVLGLIGGGFAGAVAYGVGYGFKRLRGRDALGLGDVKFFVMAGIWLGPFGLPVFMIASGLAGIGFALVWRRLGGGQVFPFGPALALGLFACLLFPEFAHLLV